MPVVYGSPSHSPELPHSVSIVTGPLAAPQVSATATPAVIVLAVTMPAPTLTGSAAAAVIQEGFRWRNDDGSETTATWLAAQDTNASIDIGDPVRLRMLLDATGDPDPSAYTLYYKKVGDVTWLPVEVGAGGGDPVYVAASANVTAGGEATTALLSAPSGKTTADFSVGRMWDDENGTDLVDIGVEWSPLDVTGLAAWFDATDDTSFTYGTGTQIASWADKSANAYTVSTTPSAGVQRTGTINGLACVTVTLGGALTRASVDVQTLVDSTSRTNCMHFAVINYTGSPLYGGWFFCNGASWRVSFDSRSPNHYFDVADGSNARLTGSYTNTTAVPYVFAVYRNGATMKAFRNGVEVLTKSDASGSASSSNLATLTFFNTPNQMAGNMGELIHVARYDAADFTDIQNYLLDKWGI